MRTAIRGTGEQYEIAESIKRMRVVDVIPNRRIEDEAELEGALDALRKAVTEVLNSEGVEAVELQ